GAHDRPRARSGHGLPEISAWGGGRLGDAGGNADQRGAGVARREGRGGGRGVGARGGKGAKPRAGPGGGPRARRWAEFQREGCCKSSGGTRSRAADEPAGGCREESGAVGRKGRAPRRWEGRVFASFRASTSKRGRGRERRANAGAAAGNASRRNARRGGGIATRTGDVRADRAALRFSESSAVAFAGPGVAAAHGATIRAHP